MSYEFSVEKEYVGVKPKNYLKKKLDLPYHILYKHLKNKRITLNGKKIKEEDLLKKGDIIKVWLDSIKLREKEIKFKEEKDLNLDVLCETEEFLVLNKLPGVVVQGAQDSSESLSLHLAYLKKKVNDFSSFEYVHIHRLDKETSGALLIGKTLEATRELNRIFSSRSVEKKYLALVYGKFKEKKGEVEVFLSRNEQNIREKVRVSSQKDIQAKKTVSVYRVLEEYSYDFEHFTLVEVELKTGYMHQIRVHMKYLGHPIVGDSMYGISRVNEKFSRFFQTQFLHATCLSFMYHEKKYTVYAPLIPQIEDTLVFLRNLE